jgi:two-component sensor histidine kinase
VPTPQGRLVCLPAFLSGVGAYSLPNRYSLSAKAGMATNDEARLAGENVRLRRLLAQAGIDAAEQKTAERLHRLLLEEMHHRVKNMLAVAMAIVAESLRSAESLENCRSEIEGRLLALGRVHDLLLQTNWTSTSLATILETAVAPFDTSGGGRFSIRSPNVEVSSEAVLPLAMVLNELCTNATKYGALSNANGEVEISATVDEPRERLRLRWAESGGPTVHLPSRRGFGTQLIEHSLLSQLQAEVQLTFGPAGVVCSLDISLASLRPPQLI